MTHVDPNEPVESDSEYSTKTDNVVLANPFVRKILNVVVGTAAIVLPVAIVVDARVDGFDWTEWTDPATAGISVLAGLLALAVTVPNIPKK